MIQFVNLGHKKSLIRNRLDISLRQKLLIGQFYRAPAYLQVLRQESGGRQLLSIRNPSALDIRLNIIIDLFVQGNPGTGIQADRQFIHNSSYFGSLKELFRDTIRLNTSASCAESLESMQK